VTTPPITQPILPPQLALIQKAPDPTPGATEAAQKNALRTPPQNAAGAAATGRGRLLDITV
jgi:hypothetical protein